MYTIIWYFITQLIIYSVLFVSCHHIVDTTHGKISGRVLKTLIKEVEYYGFTGIPYAAPPIKDLRFMPPKPIEPWNGVLKATQVKKACSQFNNNIKKGQPFGYYGSEDCLYLDVFTPSPDDNKRAVIMFIYNDHFMNSYNKTKDYEPDFFIEEDVIVVTISHRLSVFGFLSLEDEILPGNAGMKDIVVGLEWIRGNIEKFGGDPKRITLMGSQGGGAAVDLLMHSTAKDLFSSAILQGGTSWMSAYLQEDVRERAYNLAEMMNRTASSSVTLIKELNEVSPAQLVSRDFHASPKDYFKENQRSIVAFGPIVEKQSNGLITEYPENTENKIDIPIMIGFNSLEGLEMSLQYLIEPRFITFLKKDFPFLLPKRSKFRFDPFKDVFFDGADEIKNFYFRKKINMKSVPDFIRYIGDVSTAYSTNYAAQVYANKTKKQVYYYHFDYVSDLNENKRNLMKLSVVEDGTHGAAAGDELCYLFKCPDLKESYLQYHNSRAEEKSIQIKLIKLWSNFAKYGNPTPDDDRSFDGLNWPPYTNENKEYLHIDRQFEIKRDLYSNKFRFWDDFITKWERKAVHGVVTESFQKKDEL